MSLYEKVKIWLMPPLSLMWEHILSTKKYVKDFLAPLPTGNGCFVNQHFLYFFPMAANYGENMLFQTKLTHPIGQINSMSKLSLKKHVFSLISSYWAKLPKKWIFKAGVPRR